MGINQRVDPLPSLARTADEHEAMLRAAFGLPAIGRKGA
jgi:hypothetical protein